MNRLPNLFFLLLFFYFSILANGQELSTRLLGKQQGLPSETVFDLLQDDKGYIWLGTNKGLFRYDGVSFQKFSTQKQAGKSLTNLQKDKIGRIWCQSFVGELFFSDGDSLRRFELISPSGVYFPMQILDGNILCYYEKSKVKLVNLETFEIKIVFLPDTYSYVPFSQKINEKIHVIGYTDSTTVFEISKEGSLQQSKIGLRGQHVQYFQLTVGEEDFYLSKFEAKFITHKSKNGDFKQIQLPQKTVVQNFILLNAENLAICTPSGVFFVKKTAGEWAILENCFFLQNKSISCALQDKEGNFWFGTVNGGLIFCASLDSRIFMPEVFFTKLFYDSSAQKIILGTADNALFQCDTDGKNPKKLMQNDSNMEVVAIGKNQESGEIIFASDKLYLCGKKITTASKAAVKDIISLDNNRFLFSATGKIFGGTIKNERFNFDYDFLNGLRNRGLLYLSDRRLFYASTSKGIFIVNDSLQTEIKFCERSVLAESFARSGDSVFVGGSNEGILCIKNDSIVSRLTVDDGLVDNLVLRLYCHKGKLWWLNEESVQNYDLITKKTRIFDRSSGLPDAEYKDLTFAGDTVFVATSRGTAFFPVSLFDNQSPFRPETDVYVALKNKKFQPFINFSVAHDQNDIQIHFSVLHFRGAEQLKIAYRINHDEWFLLNKNVRHINLSALASGKYTVEIRSRMQGAKDTKYSKIIEFEVESPFWLSLGAYIFYILLVFLAALYILKFRFKKMEENNKIQAQKVFLEQQLQKSLLASIKSQMNPHFIFNALNTIQSYIYLNEKDNAILYLVKFSDLTRMILEMSNHEKISLADEIKTLMLYLDLEKMRFEDTLFFDVFIAENIVADNIKIPSMLIQPYVENAVKHGLLHKKDDRKLFIRFTHEDDILTVEIDDNGIGRKKSQLINAARKNKHESFSTIANQKRLELLNLGFNDHIGIEIIDKSDEKKQASGTKVILRIPLIKQ